MKISFDKVFMLLFELDSVVRSKREYSKKENRYVIDIQDLKEPVNALVKLVNQEEEK